MLKCTDQAIPAHVRTHALLIHLENDALFSIDFVVFSGGICTAKARPCPAHPILPAAAFRIIVLAVLVLVSMVCLAVSVAVMVVFEEEILEAAIRRKCHRRDT